MDGHSTGNTGATPAPNPNRPITDSFSANEPGLLVQAVEQAAEMFMMTDTSWIICYANAAIEALTGFTPQEVIGKDLSRWLCGGDDRKVAQMRRALADGEVWSGRLVNRRKNGTVFHEEVTIAPMRDKTKRITHFISVRRDVTNLVELEDQLRQSQKLESIGQLAAGIAHEINTPTQYVGDNTRFLKDAFADLLNLIDRYRKLMIKVSKIKDAKTMCQAATAAEQEADLDYLIEEIPQALSQSLEGIERVTKIVGAMKEFSHPSSGEKVNFDLNQAIHSTATVSRNEWKYVSEMELDLDPSLPFVPCMPGEFNQVMLNLIINAAHSIADKVGDGSKGKGKISISTRQVGNLAEIRIADTGVGISPENRMRIFDPFFTTKPVGKGTGQGLSIAHSVIVDKHKGTLVCDSEKGQGAVFIIRLPLDEYSNEGEGITRDLS